MENNLAVLVDFENIATGTDKEGLGRFDITAVFRRLKDKGRIVVARAYGDWGRFSRFKSTLLEEGITMVELTSHGMQDKNRADIALCVDAMELAFTRAHVDTFVVLSGDSDFTPLILRLKEFNKRVIGVGTRGSTSKLLVGACDEFIFYNSLMKTPAARKAAPQPAKDDEHGVDQALTREEAFALLEEALSGLQRDDPEPALASVVKAAMHRKDPSFNEGELGFRGFGRFLEAAHTAGMVAIRRDERSGGYLVEPAGEPGRVVPPAPPPRRPPVEATDDSLSLAARELCTLLSGEGLNPLTRAARRDLVEQVVELAADRKGRRRRLNLQSLRSELVKRARQDGHALSADAIRAGLRALREAGVFKHADGKPIRTDTAAFTLQPTDPEALLDAMDQAYIRAVLSMNLERPDTLALAELLKGDASQQQAVEETLAWVVLEHEAHDETDSPPTEEPAAPVAGDEE